MTAKPEPENATGVSFSWDSENKEVATVNKQGVVYGISVATTIITVKSSDIEVDLTYPGNKIEVVPASQATWGNIERPTAMNKRVQRGILKLSKKTVFMTITLYAT